MLFAIEANPKILFTIDDSLWTAAKLQNFVPEKSHYTAIEENGIMVLSINDILPRFRAKGFNERRILRILKCISNNVELPPILVQQNRRNSSYKYIIIDGFHRFYSSIAVGFTHIPAVEH